MVPFRIDDGRQPTGRLVTRVGPAGRLTDIDPAFLFTAIIPVASPVCAAGPSQASAFGAGAFSLTGLEGERTMGGRLRANSWFGLYRCWLKMLGILRSCTVRPRDGSNRST
jgi:hypothetical protein